ncbi:hypothetical protein C8Q76DRAFT_604210, partial [Earliella scabrosa]
AILYYDYILTLGAETERFWRRGRPSAGAVGFFLNRYLGLFGHVPVVVEFFGSNSTVDRSLTLQAYHQMLAGISQLIIGALQIFRVYALYRRNRNVLCLLVGMSSIVGVVSGWAISHTWQTHFTTLIIYTDLAVVWGSVLLFDTTVFALTLHRVAHVGEICQRSLFTLLLRDGESILLTASS